jgi:hypothetical protein
MGTTLNPSEDEVLEAHLRNFGGLSPCSLCHHDQWSIAGLESTPPFDRGQMLFHGLILPVVAIVCMRCGFVRTFAWKAVSVEANMGDLTASDQGERIGSRERVQDATYRLEVTTDFSKMNEHIEEIRAQGRNDVAVHEAEAARQTHDVPERYRTIASVINTAVIASALCVTEILSQGSSTWLWVLVLVMVGVPLFRTGIAGFIDWKRKLRTPD